MSHLDLRTMRIIDTVEKPMRHRDPWSRTKKQRSRDGGGGRRGEHGGTCHRGNRDGNSPMRKFWERANRANAKRLMRDICRGLVDPDDCSEIYMRTTTGAPW